jgi:predicted  nucleic acid-binding Zn-ribbon protein
MKNNPTRVIHAIEAVRDATRQVPELADDANQETYRYLQELRSTVQDDIQNVSSQIHSVQASLNRLDPDEERYREKVRIHRECIDALNRQKIVLNTLAIDLQNLLASFGRQSQMLHMTLKETIAGARSRMSGYLADLRRFET